VDTEISLSKLGVGVHEYQTRFHLNPESSSTRVSGRMTQTGSIMGISRTLYESLAFDESTITSDDWDAIPS